MFIKRLRRMLEADAGDGVNGGGNTGNTETTTQTTDTETSENNETKTFTQDDIDKAVNRVVTRERKNQVPKEELEAYNTWKESQKTEEEKKNEALTNAEKARIAAEEKATALEAKVTCLSKGVNATSVDDVVVLAKAMVTDEITIEQAIDKVLEKYETFKGVDKQQEEPKGFKIGASSSEKEKVSEDTLSKIFGNKK